MKKTLICLFLALTLVLSTTAAVFAVDDVGARVIVKDPPIIVKPLVDDVGA